MQEDVYQGDGLNLYAYCGNNPVMYYDPSGYSCKNSGDIAGDGGTGKLKSEYKTGDLYESYIMVNGHRIDAIAEIEVHGERLILKDMAMYSNEGDIPNQIGTGEIFKWLKDVKKQARNQGFKELQIIAQRAEHSTSANPGHIIDRVFNL